MLSDVRNKEIEELFSTPIVQQTAFWSKVKNRLGTSTIAINFKSGTKSLFSNTLTNSPLNSDVLIILQYVNSTECIAYVPYGPELEPDADLQGKFLEELSECLRSFLPRHCIMIRYDLCWESYWANDDSFFDPDGKWLGEPSTNVQEMRFNFNTFHWNFKKAHSNILPANTIYLNLTPDIDVILGRMKPKTRYNINLSLKKGVQVRKAGIESLPVWYALYRETALRNNILVNDIKYFEAILASNADDTNSPATAKLLIAALDNTPLAAMFLVITAKRGSYLYGASTGIHRNYMATYALQWEAIRISKESGCTEYDMFGISPNSDSSHPLYGLYKFKSGFGGDIFHGLGCWDYPYDDEQYNHFKNFELRSQGFHLGN